MAKVNLPLSDKRLRLFLEGKEDCLAEGLLVPVKKNKGKDYRRRFSAAQEEGAQHNYVPPFGGIPAPPSYYGDVPTQAWGSTTENIGKKVYITPSIMRGELRNPPTYETVYIIP
jgi:hypothetical protein